MRRAATWLFTAALVLALTLSVLAVGEAEAQKLYDLGLLAGKGMNADGSVNFDLAGSLTRAEATTQVVRFLGKEQAAKADAWTHPFTDLAVWAEPYVGYAFANGVTRGVSATLFDGDAQMTDAQFLTLILRVLGYSDADGEFVWNDPYTLANAVGLTDTAAPMGRFSRGDAFAICYRALTATAKGETPLAGQLIAAGAITAEAWATVSAERVQLPASATDPQSYFVSPFYSIAGGDPFVFYDTATEKYYMYLTVGKCTCYSSATGKNWVKEGDAYAVTDRTFGEENFWAPEVYAYNGAYYMVYSAARILENGQKRHSIGIAKADAPTGPFVDLYAHPLLDPDYSVIDASLLFAGSGRIYLYFSKDCSENVIDGKNVSQIYGVQVYSDFSGVYGEPTLLTTPDAPWELKSGNPRWNEGPFVFERDGVYYLLYSANYYASVQYAVGYATADDPLGPFVKAKNNPILIGDGQRTAGTGHCSLFTSPDGSETYIVYHSLSNPANPASGGRVACMDKLIVAPDGSLAVNGPSTVLQPLPSGTAGYRKLLAGVTATSTYPAVLGKAENLTDEAIAYTGTSADDLYRFQVTDDGWIELTLDTPQPLSAIWIYGIRSTAHSPRSVYAVVNDTYITAEKTFSAVSLAPAVLSLDGIPQGTAVERIRLYVTALDGADGMAALSEIVLLTK